jgi:hypothetical protein
MKKQELKAPQAKMKEAFETLNIKQLKFLAGKHYIRIKGQVVDWNHSRDATGCLFEAFD